MIHPDFKVFGKSPSLWTAVIRGTFGICGREGILYGCTYTQELAAKGSQANYIFVVIQLFEKQDVIQTDLGLLSCLLK